MYVTRFTTCLDFGSNTWEISAWLPPGCCRHGIVVHCMCVQISSLYAAEWPVLLICMQLTLVTLYVVSMLYCHCWMFSLSNTLPMQSYPSKVWFLCVAVHEISSISWQTLWRRWLHSCRMFILIVEYGLVHWGDCINCETCNFCFDLAFVWPSLGRADFHSA